MKTKPESENHLAIVMHRTFDPSVLRRGINVVLPSMLTGMDSPIAANSFPTDAVELVVMARSEPPGQFPGRVCIERMPLSEHCWNTLLTEGRLEELKSDIRHGALLEPSVAAQVELVENSYRHDPCDVSWKDQWSCGCDDECPHCGTSVTVVSSEPVRTLRLDERGIWNLISVDDKELKHDVSEPKDPSDGGAKRRGPGM